MNKVIRDGQVAVLYSPGFGAGWYTWNSLRGESEEQSLQLIFDPIIVELVEKRNGDNYREINNDIENRGEEILSEGYFGGAGDLTIAWLPVGTKFLINEYDGSESIQTIEDLWLTA
jgi:hypothetical protein